jgi:hypothetical protein
MARAAGKGNLGAGSSKPQKSPPQPGKGYGNSGVKKGRGR